MGDSLSRSYIVAALCNIGSKTALEHIFYWSEIDSTKREREIYGIDDYWIDTRTNDHFLEKMAIGLFNVFGYRAVEQLRKRHSIAHSRVGQRRRKIIKYIENNHIAGVLRSLNLSIERNKQLGREGMEQYFARLKNSPEVLYIIFALSQEINSHSFPLAYQYLKEYIVNKYGSFDVFRYIHEDWRFRGFLYEFLFTASIFQTPRENRNVLEECFENTMYSPNNLADLVIHDELIERLLQKPVLFAKIISNIMDLKDTKLRDKFKQQIIRVANERGIEERIKILITLMLDFNIIPKTNKVTSLRVNLPEYHASWKGPQKFWIDKDGAIVIDLFWSTDKEGEKTHYKEFPEIFTNGASVNSFYKNFKGYIDRSNEAYYQDKLKKRGAEKVLVKEFAQTGRRTEIYLYPNLDRIKQSKASIKMSRSYAGKKGNNNYSGLPGTLRFASHSRSINDADSLIKANPDSPIIAITGTGRAQETNPVLYYMLEYLGTESTWGNWSDIKEYIAPHISRSIQKYNFPTDDLSFIYGAILQEMKKQRTLASNIELEILGIFNVLKSYITNPSLQNL